MLRLFLENLRYAWQDWRRGPVTMDDYCTRFRAWWVR